MVFHNRQRNISALIPTIHINGQPIERVTEFNFLGLIIDQHLNWEAHIQKTSNKISRALGIMYRLKRFLPRNILRLLYNSLILPHLQYCIMIWGYKSSRVAKLQKNSIRTLCNSKYNAHTEPLFKNMNLLKVSDIFKTRIIRFYYKHVNGTLPRYFENQFRGNSEIPPYLTLRNREIQLNRFNTTHGGNTLRHFLPPTISSLPPCIIEKIETHSYNGFSRYVNKYIINSYSSVCEIENCYICENT